MLITETMSESLKNSFKQLVHNTDSFRKWLLSHWIIYLTDLLAITDKFKNAKCICLWLNYLIIHMNHVSNSIIFKESLSDFFSWLDQKHSHCIAQRWN